MSQRTRGRRRRRRRRIRQRQTYVEEQPKCPKLSQYSIELAQNEFVYIKRYTELIVYGYTRIMSKYMLSSSQFQFKQVSCDGISITQKYVGDHFWIKRRWYNIEIPLEQNQQIMALKNSKNNYGVQSAQIYQKSTHESYLRLAGKYEQSTKKVSKQNGCKPVYEYHLRNDHGFVQ